MTIRDQFRKLRAAAWVSLPEVHWYVRATDADYGIPLEEPVILRHLVDYQRVIDEGEAVGAMTRVRRSLNTRYFAGVGD